MFLIMKKVEIIVKLQIPAGKANPAPPVGPALGQHGLNIQQFCSEFNEKTKKQIGDIIPVEISVYEDRTFSFICKTSPASDLIRKAAGIEKGSGEPHKTKAGKITKRQLEEITKKKMPDLSTDNLEQAMKIIEGTARSMGVTVEN